MDKSKYKVPIYSGKIEFIFFSEDETKDIKKIYHVYEIENYDAVTLSYESKTKWCILFNKDRLTPGIIAHEAKHMLNYIFHYNGLKLDLDNDEAECYFLTWLVNRIHESARKFNLTIK